MKTRIITAIFAIIIFIPLVALSELSIWFALVPLSALSTLMCGEFLTAKKLQKQPLIFYPSLVYAALMPLLIGTVLKFLPVYLFTLVLFIFTIVFHEKLDLDDVMFAYAGVLMITFSMATIAFTISQNGGHASFWIVLIVGVPWLSDSAAYFVGSSFGKHKLCPVVSPKKSVEGAAAGVIGGTVGAIVIGLVYLLIYRDVTINFWALLLIGVLNSVIGIFGDLTFSIIKRKCDIKDFGSIMPGHGGMLDRFDSVLFCAPLVMILSRVITIIS